MLISRRRPDCFSNFLIGVMTCPVRGCEHKDACIEVSALAKPIVEEAYRRIDMLHFAAYGFFNVNRNAEAMALLVHRLKSLSCLVHIDKKAKSAVGFLKLSKNKILYLYELPLENVDIGILIKVYTDNYRAKSYTIKTTEDVNEIITVIRDKIAISRVQIVRAHKEDTLCLPMITSVKLAEVQ